jgi:hypothetical protein
MAFLSQTVTFTGTAVRATTEPTFLSSLRIESEAGNGIVYFGDSGVSNTDYAGSIKAGASDPAAVFLGPYVAAPIPLHQLYFLGTSGQKIHLFGTVL